MGQAIVSMCKALRDFLLAYWMFEDPEVKILLAAIDKYIKAHDNHG